MQYLKSYFLTCLLLFCAVIIAQENEDLPLAETLYRCGVDAHEKGRDIEAETYRKYLFDISFTYEKLWDYTNAIEYAIYGYQLSLLKDKRSSWEYCESLRCISGIYKNIPDSVHRAIELAEQSLKIVKKIKGKESAEYALYLSLTADCYNVVGNTKKVVQYMSEAVQILKRINPYSDDYLNVLGGLLSAYTTENDYSSALDCARELCVYSKHSPELYCLALLEYGNLCVDMGDKAKAEELMIEIISVQEKYDLYTEEYWDAIGMLRALKESNDSEFMKLFYKQLDFISKYKESSGFDKLTYISMLYDIAWTLYNYGDEGGAHKIYIEIISICNELPLTYRNLSVEALLKLAKIASHIDLHEDALAFCESAAQILSTEPQTDYTQIKNTLSTSAICYSNMGEYKRAIQCQKAAIEMVLKDENPNSLALCKSFCTLAYLYIQEEKYDSAALCLGYVTENDTIIKNQSPSDYSWALYLASEILLHEQYYEHAYKMLEYSYLLWYEDIIQSLKFYSHIQRELYLLQYLDRFQRPLLYEVKYPQSRILNRLCYNILWFKKGLLWQYQKNMNIKSIDSQLYSENNVSKNYISSYLQGAAIEYESISQLNMDSISKIVIRNDCFIHSSNDITVEFGNCQYKDTIFYIALILRKNWDAPKCVILGNEAELDSMSYPKLQQAVWQAIIDSAQIKEGENIYFAPDGIFYNIPIEYLPTADGRNMSDKYNMYRVSSTRELCYRDTANTYSTAVLYGGLRYDATPPILFAQNSSTRGWEESIHESVLSQWRADDRAKYNYLPYTLKEVDSISQTIGNAIQVTTYTDKEGSEESFKALSGHSPSILHIATHGYYITPTKAEMMSKENMYRYSLTAVGERQSVIDYSMERTGLLMAGAQCKLRGDSIPQTAEDGILSAKEISHLDLTNTDLVVLSACQTALGDITNDGVAGLQRGFKIAGVKSVLMSLWKVDDAATYLLMKQFYKSLFTGKNKQQALRDAQNYLRSYMVGNERPYNDIHYWGAFILLDAIEK